MINETDIWKDYRRGRDYLNSINLPAQVRTCFDMVAGDQWRGLKYGKEKPPQLNILYPIMKSSTALVGQNVMTIEYITDNWGADRQNLIKVCEKLNSYTRSVWERLKMDRQNWQILQDAFIGGSAAYWFYDDSASGAPGKIMAQQLDTTALFLADEQQPDIQKQPYILIAARKQVEDVKKTAKENGLSDDEIARIVPDTDPEMQTGDRREVAGSKKVTLITKLWKQGGCVHIARATKTALVQPDTQLKGLSRYPIAIYLWKPKKGSARGQGDIWDKIPNQISINKSLFRMEQALKANGYPIKVYQQNAIDADGVSRLNQPGASIALKGMGGLPLSDIIGYLQPGDISPYAKSYWQDLIGLTRDLSGSGDSLENINPEQASGAAIQAVLDAKMLNVSMQVAAFRQFVEDIAWIWYEMFVAYNPGGLTVHSDEGTVHITPQQLKGLEIDIRVKATPSSATHAAIKDARLKELLEKGIISFEEYVSVLAEDSTMPVDALKKIARGRSLPPVVPVENVELTGGDIYEMPIL